MAVPNVPGVPALNRAGQAALPNIALLVADAAAVLAMFQAVNWGIYDQNGRAVVVGSNVKAVDYRNDRRLSDYPVEQGGFATYNKVALPYDIKVTFTKGGSVGERAQFLAAVERVLNSIELFSVVTPEFTYTNVNVIHVDYRRTQRQGATLLTVDVWCEQVRQTATLQFSATKSPDGSAQINDGTVQAQPPTAEQTNAVTRGAPGGL